MSGTSKGEYRVGITFNPSGDPAVRDIKAAAANLIDMIEDISHPGDIDSADAATCQRESEVGRLKALAQTHIEDGAMWAVKAATKRKPEGVS